MVGEASADDRLRVEGINIEGDEVKKGCFCPRLKAENSDARPHRGRVSVVPMGAREIMVSGWVRKPGGKARHRAGHHRHRDALGSACARSGCSCRAVCPGLVVMTPSIAARNGAQAPQRLELVAARQQSPRADLGDCRPASVREGKTTTAGMRATRIPTTMTSRAFMTRRILQVGDQFQICSSRTRRLRGASRRRPYDPGDR